jgi:hypothetical protein
MSKEIRAWECEKCRKAYINKVVADDCCKDKPVVEFSNCRVCGADIQKNKTICYECLQKERYEKGEKIKYSEYELNWLYDEGSERYFGDIYDIAEYYEDIEIDMPKWVYGCDVIDFKIDIDSVLESASENMYEDFDYSQESVDLKELYDYVEEWNKKQTATAYESNYKKIILLNE